MIKEAEEEGNLMLNSYPVSEKADVKLVEKVNINSFEKSRPPIPSKTPKEE